jgi:hypothetical protein
MDCGFTNTPHICYRQFAYLMAIVPGQSIGFAFRPLLIPHLERWRNFFFPITIMRSAILSISLWGSIMKTLVLKVSLSQEGSVLAFDEPEVFKGLDKLLDEEGDAFGLLQDDLFQGRFQMDRT